MAYYFCDQCHTFYMELLKLLLFTCIGKDDFQLGKHRNVD